MSDRSERAIQVGHASKSDASGGGRAADEPAAPEELYRPGHSRRRAALRATGTAMVSFVAMLGATLLPAQAQFTSITGFGDSYAACGQNIGLRLLSLRSRI